jgi:hypothetical protein
MQAKGIDPLRAREGEEEAAQTAAGEAEDAAARPAPGG